MHVSTLRESFLRERHEARRLLSTRAHSVSRVCHFLNILNILN
jgi:hypothetical protein